MLTGRLVRLSTLSSGLQILLVGGVAAGLGYLIGVAGPKLFGG